MIKRCFAILLLALMMPLATAQDGNPTIAILSLGPNLYPAQEGAILTMLQVNGFISADEQQAALGYNDLQGEKVNIIWGNANNNLADVNIMVETMLDQSPDALVAFSTKVAQVAVNITNDMDDPPTTLFAAVVNPVGAGIVESDCVKPAHVTGVQRYVDYEVIVDALQTQDPDLAQIGVIFAVGDLASEDGLRRTEAAADARGIAVVGASVVEPGDLAVATDGLLGKGVDAIALPTSALLAPGYGIVVEAALDAGVPVVASTVTAIYLGVTFGIGEFRVLQEGYDIGRLLVAELNGELDTAATGVHTLADSAIGINLDSAALADIEIAQSLIEQADSFVADDHYLMAPRMILDMFQNMPVTDEMVLMLIQAAGMPGVSVEEGMIQVPMAMMLGAASGLASLPPAPNPEADAAFIESLRCE